MASLSVTVAAYGSVEAAAADWQEVDRARKHRSNVIDAILIERSGRRVATVHQFSLAGWARGAVASALVGRLAPAALLDGAIAGGVGSQAMCFVSNGLSVDAVSELVRVFESGRFVTLAVVERGQGPTSAGYGSRALGVASLPMHGTALDLRRAVRDDEADE